MAIPKTDVSHYPIAHVTFSGTLSAQDLEAHLANITTLFKERGPMLIIADLDALDIGPTERAEFAKKIDVLSKQNAFIAEFIVVRSAVKRGIFTAYSWLRSVKKHPMRVFHSFDDAFADAQRFLKSQPAARDQPPSQHA